MGLWTFLLVELNDNVIGDLVPGIGRDELLLALEMRGEELVELRKQLAGLLDLLHVGFGMLREPNAILQR